MSDDDGLTRTEQKIRTLVAIRSYLRERRDDPTLKPTYTIALAWEIEHLNEAIAKAEAEAAQ